MRRTPEPDFLLTRNELQGYSLRNALAYLLDPSHFGREAGLEVEVSGRALVAGAARHESGIFVPFEVLQRDLVVGTPSAGGNLVATDVDGFVELLRPSSAVVAAGATVLTQLRGNVAVPRMTSGASPEWVAENSGATETQPSFDQVTLSPKTVTGWVDVSRRLILQANQDALSLVGRDLVDSLGTALDKAAIAGSGASNQPRGILNTAGIGAVAGGTNGAAPTIDHAIDLETAVANANTAASRGFAYVTNTKVRGKLQRTQMFSGTNGVPVWQRAGGADYLNGRPAMVSNNVPSNLTKGSASGICSAIIYGAWADLVIGTWGAGITLMLDPYTGGTSGTVRVIAMLDADVAVRYATSFAAMQDALTS